MHDLSARNEVHKIATDTFVTDTIATDTIAAIATPAGVGGIGIVRVSGPGVAFIIDSLFGGLTPRQASFKKFRDASGAVIDHGVALYFAAPNSYTGEDVLELQGHGGSVLMQLLLARTLELGARHAEPGEFTRRAFLNGKIDLAQAEAVADVVGSATANAARAAMNSLQGPVLNPRSGLDYRAGRAARTSRGGFGLSGRTAGRRRRYARTGATRRTVSQTPSNCKAAPAGGRYCAEGLKVVIAGRPNVGKSSLFNALLGVDRVIVSATPGTTRDVIVQTVGLDGLAVQLIDTAGVRDTDDRIEKEGMSRARREADAANVVIVVREYGNAETAGELEFLAGLEAQVIVVYNKIDLHGQAPQRRTSDGATVLLSAKTLAGVDLLEAEIKRCAGIGDAMQGDFTARERHLDALQRAHDFLLAARARTAPDATELLAEHLRLAQRSLAEITGDFTADDLLGEIFASFCVGK